jgi:hypothetical protein
MVASSAGKREYGDKEGWVQYWVRLGCWISPCYGPFSLGARFETCEPFISLIFNFFSGRGKSWITENADTESVITGGRARAHTHTHTHTHTYIYINLCFVTQSYCVTLKIGTFSSSKNFCFQSTRELYNGGQDCSSEVGYNSLCFHLLLCVSI